MLKPQENTETDGVRRNFTKLIINTYRDMSRF